MNKKIPLFQEFKAAHFFLHIRVQRNRQNLGGSEQLDLAAETVVRKRALSRDVVSDGRDRVVADVGLIQ